MFQPTHEHEAALGHHGQCPCSSERGLDVGFTSLHLVFVQAGDTTCDGRGFQGLDDLALQVPFLAHEQVHGAELLLLCFADGLFGGHWLGGVLGAASIIEGA